MMSRYTLLAAAFLVAPSSMAQLEWGVKAGLNVSVYTFAEDSEPDEAMDPEVGPGWSAGGQLTFRASEDITLVSELLYSARSTQAAESISLVPPGSADGLRIDSERRTDLAYMEWPLLIAFTPTPAFRIEAGPALGYLLSARSRSETTTTTTAGGQTNRTTERLDSRTTDGLRPLEMAAVLGMRYVLDGGLNFGLRYWRGLNTLNEVTEEVDGSTMRTNANVIQLSVGFLFSRNQRHPSAQPE